MRRRNLLTLTLTATVLAAGQHRTAGKPGQSPERSIRQMVTDSPWAREANVTIKGDGGALIGMASGPFGQNGGESGDRGGIPAVPKIVVRWDSAAPVCEACARGGLERYLFSCYSKLMYLSGLSAKFDELSKAFYILSMSNYPKPPLGRDGDAPQHSAASNAALERMGERLRQATLIRRKGKAPLRPAKALVLPAGEALLPVIFFTRKDNITLEDREVLFESEGERIVVTAKFNLKKMVLQGKLEL
jgi:hypothetical protein